MEISFELFITVSLSFMFTFVFGKLVSMATTPEDNGECKSFASAMKPKSEPEAGLKSLVDSNERNSFDERCFLERRVMGKEEEEEDEEISGDSIEVARFQRIPVQDRAEFEACAAEESKRLVEFHREIVVSDLNSECFDDDFLEQSGFRKGICEIEIELVEKMEVKPIGENLEEGEEEEEENNRDSEIEDWVAVERKDLEELFGNNDIVGSGYGEKN